MSTEHDRRASTPRRGRRMTKRTAFAAGGSVLALGMLGGGIAFASGTIPGPNGVINACYGTQPSHGRGGDHGRGARPGAGQLRVVPEGTSCRHNEASLSWNQKGPQGPQGAKGPQGAAGVNG
ncbi:MAG: hypothetical protein ACRDYD_14330, partial [Acidimicrobiales bacterium]